MWAKNLLWSENHRRSFYLLDQIMEGIHFPFIFDSSLSGYHSWRRNRDPRGCQTFPCSATPPGPASPSEILLWQNSAGNIILPPFESKLHSILSTRVTRNVLLPNPKRFPGRRGCGTFRRTPLIVAGFTADRFQTQIVPSCS